MIFFFKLVNIWSGSKPFINIVLKPQTQMCSCLRRTFLYPFHLSIHPSNCHIVSCNCDFIFWYFTLFLILISSQVYILYIYNFFLQIFMKVGTKMVHGNKSVYKINVLKNIYIQYIVNLASNLTYFCYYLCIYLFISERYYPQMYWMEWI